MKKLTAILLMILIFGFIAFLIYSKKQTPSNDVIVITLTEDGFVPDQVKIKKGDTVQFKSTAGNPFWPASDIHPTHSIYSEFDPKDAIMPDKTWSFQFNNVGSWRFHDHLGPYFTGKITVTK